MKIPYYVHVSNRKGRLLIAMSTPLRHLTVCVVVIFYFFIWQNVRYFWNDWHTKNLLPSIANSTARVKCLSFTCYFTYVFLCLQNWHKLWLLSVSVYKISYPLEDPGHPAPPYRLMFVSLALLAIHFKPTFNMHMAKTC